jgi:hypothetical protein
VRAWAGKGAMGYRENWGTIMAMGRTEERVPTEGTVVNVPMINEPKV